MSSAESSLGLLKKVTNHVSIGILRMFAVILFVAPIFVFVRGYMIVGGQKESGWRMYAFCLISGVWAGILWRWSKRK